MTISPCKYPRCADHNGDPELTGDGMCDRCQRRFARLLARLTVDWVNLHAHLPTPPARRQAVRIAPERVYGHPAEWASDTAARIAVVLNETHDALADHLGETPPPHPGVTEHRRVRAAWYYLECRVPELALYPGGGDIAAEWLELHNQIRARLGLTQPRQLLPTPCPACELRTLERTVSPYNDSIECGACGHLIREEHYPFYARVVLDTILDDAA
ncbi:hypothetical protein IU501_10835 [Nocardia otitidiscaviarum]|uniref:hypothetical protein n=1 Tax=Nocardia otitidiscaviarum TaxID=1823 RepID=UPI0018933D56|nr:hypothetical protein [Nocardia otitidiscaviarum]MBF6133494.1 hypothetical protein [Nocardia otitidiscaviarum]